MTVQEVARLVMKVTKTTQADVAKSAGLSGQSVIAMYLKSDNMRVDSLLTILNACGYELVARSMDGTTPEYVIGEEDNGMARKIMNMKGFEDRIRAIISDELERRGGTPDL